MERDVITLYPGNWLYNAGVIGLLISIEKVEKLDKYYFLKDDGSLDINKNVFLRLNVQKRYFGTSEERIATITGNTELYKNYLQKSWEDKFHYFVENLSFVEEKSFSCCDLCGRKIELPENIIEDLSNKGLAKFLEGIKRFDMRHNSFLGASLGEFPNTFWGGRYSSNICPLCAFVIIHYHLSFTQLSDNSEIFINAPSFKVIWYLNKYVQEVYESKRIGAAREILGMSLIEMASKLYIQLGKWIMMNIEVVSKDKNDRIDFFSLPYEIVLLLSDRNIASLLNEIGEMSVLRLVLDGNFKRILELGEKIFKIVLKPEKEREKQEREFINNLLKKEENKKSLISFSQKLFKLYALIEEKLRGGVLG